MDEYVTEFNWDDVDECGNPWLQARERVVRCRECKHARIIEAGKIWRGCIMCEHFAMEGCYQTVEPDGFCAWGEAYSPGEP